MHYKIFYSWQSDLPSKDNRNFIESILNKVVKELKSETIFLSVDRDTKNLLGTPDINEAIFKKISDSDIFVCDISIINNALKGRKVPNPNVLIELGYAARELGWEKVILLYNTKYGVVEDIPFDLKTKRVFQYNSESKDEKERLVKIFSRIISEMYTNQKLYSPVKDHLKGKIDYCYLEILKQLSVLVFGKYGMSESLSYVNHLINSKGKLNGIIVDQEILGFFIYKNFDEIVANLDNLLSIVSSSVNYSKNWSVHIIKLKDSIRRYEWNLSKRRNIELYNKSNSLMVNYEVISSYDMNDDNPKNSYILTLKKSGGNNVVINSGIIIGDKNQFTCGFKIAASEIDEFCVFIDSVITITEEWLDASGDEFILDPDYYHIM